MEELLLLFGLLVLFGIVAGILAIVAFRRSGVHADRWMISSGSCPQRPSA